ncbi:PLP-dependent transferase [Natrinema sp. DC36]|uniref:PLP-dependent transferase n=1 Tax=Natrinema sp. DC36 TaxID=2878680 RepID=UPI00210206B5|nr:PLP-dependent transferase [Natrinema sp. DC36]
MVDPDNHPKHGTHFNWTNIGATNAGDVVSPIHLSTTHDMHSPNDSNHGYKYTHFGNPTRDVLEDRLAEVCG